MALVKNDEPADAFSHQGMIIKAGAKMSKSLGNTVSPDDMWNATGGRQHSHVQRSLRRRPIANSIGRTLAWKA